jgi:hypothetical protein
LLLARARPLQDISKNKSHEQKMSRADTAYNYDRYRRLLAEADSESKRLAFIQLLIQEKAKDRLAEHLLHARKSAPGLPAETSSPRAAPPTSENASSKSR